LLRTLIDTFRKVADSAAGQALPEKAEGRLPFKGVISMRNIVRLTLAAGAALVALTPAAADHDWDGYHWAGNGSTVALKINKSVNGTWSPIVHTAVLDWDLSTEISLTEQVSTADPKKCNPIAGQILVCNAAYGKRGWLGIATIWLSQGHISQGTTKLNDSYHNSAPYNTTPWRSLVGCQEIGHVFGLDHQDENFNNPNLGTCMDYTNNPSGPPANTKPDAHDIAELSIIYNHDDGFTTSSSSTNFGLRQVGKAVPQGLVNEGPAGDSPAEWGRAIRFDRQGRPDVFQLEIAPGRQKITHVFWAIGEGPRGAAE
jgi:hypothetical protein